MNTRNTIIASTLAAATLVSGANADIFTGSGGTVTDNNPTGNRFTINVGQSMILSGVSVTLINFRHDYMGDLAATLYHMPTNSLISLFDRVGRATSANNNAGDNSDFNGTYTFADGGGSLWAAAAGKNSSGDITSGNYAATGSGIGSTTNIGPVALSFADAFGGIDGQGDWVLEIRDLRNSQTVSSGWSWSVELATVPAPGALALLGAAGLVGFRRRR